jgi:hypothetical protein
MEVRRGGMTWRGEGSVRRELRRGGGNMMKMGEAGCGVVGGRARDRLVIRSNVTDLLRPVDFLSR